VIQINRRYSGTTALEMQSIRRNDAVQVLQRWSYNKRSAVAGGTGAEVA
jgi:hypothetical protein